MAHFEDAGFSVVMAVPWRRIAVIHAIHLAVGGKARRGVKRVGNEFRAGDHLVDGRDTDFRSAFDHHLNARTGLKGLRKVGAGANA